MDVSLPPVPLSKNKLINKIEKGNRCYSRVITRTRCVGGTSGA